MIETLSSAFDVLLDRPPADLVGAVMIALTLSLVMTGLYALRRKKSEPLVMLVVLMLCANGASMALAAGYIVKTWKADGVIPGGNNPTTARVSPQAGSWHGAWGHSRPPADPAPKPPEGPDPTGQFFAVADADRDGRLTPEEAALFVRAAGSEATGSVDVGGFYSAIRGNLARPTGASSPPRPVDSDEPR